MADQPEATRVLYHKNSRTDANPQGAIRMYRVDANHALQFSDEWSDEPWPTEDDAARVEIPDDWETTSPQARLALARKLGAAKTVKVVDADAMIRAEAAKRAPPKKIEQPKLEPTQVGGLTPLRTND